MFFSGFCPRLPKTCDAGKIGYQMQSGNKPLFALVRAVVPILLLTLIVYWVLRKDPDAVARFVASPKRWNWLLASFLAYLSGVLITFWRWFLLVRALAIPFRFRDAMRLGFVGFFFQFFSLGAVGGDLFKAIFIAREHPTRRPEAVATIVIDRAVGLFALLIVTSLAFVWIGWDGIDPRMHPVAITCFLLTGGGAFVVTGLLWTNVTTATLRRFFRRFPAIAVALIRGEHAMQRYRDHRGVFLLALGSAMVSHTILAISGYCAARGLLEKWPPFGNQIALWNMAGAVGALPFSPAGVGQFEAAYVYFFQALSTVGNTRTEGVFVSFTIRLITLMIAGIGVVFYCVERRDFQQLMNQASEIDHLQA